jgi:hypothetical protein
MALLLGTCFCTQAQAEEGARSAAAVGYQKGVAAPDLGAPPSSNPAVQADTPVVPIHADDPLYHSHWMWIVGGAAVAAVATTLILVYGNRNRYPSNTFGTQVIGN